MFAAICRFQIKPEHRQDFIEALAEHGRAAVPTEPGTLRFDVIEQRNDAHCVFLYEAYADTDAFQAHLWGPSHQQLVRTLTANDWLVTPLDEPAKPPFRPFVIGSGFSLFTSAETA
jgi:quinol monooxygenase YgiN